MAGEIAEQLFLVHSSEQTQLSIQGLFDKSEAESRGGPALINPSTPFYTKPVKDMGRRGTTLYLINQARRAVKLAFV